MIIVEKSILLSLLDSSFQMIESIFDYLKFMHFTVHHAEL